MNNRVIVIGGPTASGKTALSLELAEKVNGEIVSADSMQIYRGMDIGTAKATPEERRRVPHHMIDIADPAEDYSVARYVEEASRCCDGLLARGKTPVITGGTGLYVDSLLSGRFFSETSSDPSLRQELTDRYDRIGGPAMLEELARFDPERAAKLSPNDKKRIVRAVEVYLLSGTTITEHDALTRSLPPRYEAEFHILGLDDRESLYERINKRVDRMMEEGLLQEVRTLLDHVPASATAMQAIGYKELTGVLKGGLSLEEAVEQIKLASRRYAKRQISWFKKYKSQK